MAGDELAQLADEVVTGALSGPDFSKRLDALSPADRQALVATLAQKQASYSERSELASDQARIFGLALEIKALPDGEWEPAYEALSESDKAGVTAALRDSARGGAR
jgi:hypothetical protein